MSHTTTDPLPETQPDNPPENPPERPADAHIGYADLADRFGAVVDALPTVGWDAASPCEGWTGRDVVEHVVTTQRSFMAQNDIDADAGGDGRAGPAAVWHAHDDRMRDLLADPAVSGKGYEGMFGPTTVGESIVRFYGFDLIVHRWDLAQAAGIDEVLSEEELTVIDTAADGFGEHLYGDGICRPALQVPADADRQTTVLARLGRRAGAHTA